MGLAKPEERIRFFKFAAVGFLGAVVDFGVFNLLSTFLNIPAVIASVISFTAAITSNFLWNRFWIYPDSRSKKVHHQVGQFALVNLIGLFIRTPIFAFLQPTLGKEFRILGAENYGIHSDFLGHNFALAIAVLVVMLWNFFANRYWTYNDIDN
jgi:putative flippase GtrA